MTKRIKGSDLICGRPAFEIRSLFRHIGWYSLSLDQARERLDLSGLEAKRFLRLLVAEGYLERDKRYPNVEERLWKLTDKGVELARATAAPPIHRRTADRLLAEVIQRAELTWSNPSFVYRVRRLAVFGSYLTDARTLGDLDVAVELAPLFSDSEQQWRARLNRVNVARAQGRSFGGIVAELQLPVTEVFLFLRNRHRALSLIDAIDRSDFLADVPQRTVYEHYER